MELEASGLQIGYGEHVIVNQMDVSIARDKITTIIGPNGSGKSTLLKNSDLELLCSVKQEMEQPEKPSSVPLC